MNKTIYVLLVMMAGLATVAGTDIFLPSLPSMAVYFAASEDAIRLSIPVYLTGSLCAAPILGALSDRLGRRRVLLMGLGVFLLGTAICLVSPSIHIFLVGRFIQGSGAIVSPVVGWAILQDLYTGERGAKIMAWAGSIVSVGPFVAPGLGGYIHVAYGWQGNFVVIFLFAAMVTLLMLCFTAEKTTTGMREKLSYSTTVNNFKAILRDVQFLCYVSLFGLLACGEICYLTIAPFYFENTLHLSPDVFGLYLSLSASFYIIGAFSAPYLLVRFSVEKTIKIGLAMPLVGSALLLGVNFLCPSSLVLIVLAMGLYFLGAAIVWGPSTSCALQPFKTMRGSASALRSMIFTAMFAVGGFLGSILDDTSIMPLAIFLLVMAMGCWASLYRVLKFERIAHGPVS